MGEEIWGFRIAEILVKCEIKGIFIGLNFTDSGLYLNSDEDNEAAYYVGIDLVMGRLTFDRWPRKRSDYPFMLETERKIPVEPGQSYCVDVIKEGSVLGLYFV